jgi:integrase
LAIIKRGKTWWYEFTYQGVRYRESSHSTNKEVCRRAAAERKRKLELNINSLAEIQKPKKCSTALDECRELNNAHWAEKTQELHQNSQQHLEPFFGKLLLSEITPEHIAKYQNKRKKEGVSNRTINIEIGLLRLALKKARLWGNIQDDVRMLKENKDVGRELSPDEQHRILSAAKNSASRSLYPALLTSIHTGLRSKELRTLQWRQVDLLAGEILVGKSKTEGGEGRRVPLSETAIGVLKQWRSQFHNATPKHFVFPREKYGLMGQKGTFGGKVAPYETFPNEPVGSFATAWRTAKKVAAVECRWHDLRHSAVSAVAAGGATDGTLQSLFGWLSPKMIERYSHVRNEAKRHAVSIFDRPLPTSTTQ